MRHDMTNKILSSSTDFIIISTGCDCCLRDSLSFRISLAWRYAVQIRLNANYRLPFCKTSAAILSQCASNFCQQISRNIRSTAEGAALEILPSSPIRSSVKSDKMKRMNSRIIYECGYRWCTLLDVRASFSWRSLDYRFHHRIFARD